MTERLQRIGWSGVAMRVVLVFAVLQAIVPLIWMTFGSLKSYEEYYSNIWGLPQAWQFSNYSNAWDEAEVGSYLGNSLVIVAIGLVVLLLTSILAGYALARVTFRGRELLFGLVLATMMIPPDILTIPLFIILRDLKLLGHSWTLSLIYAAGGFGLSTFLMRGYFMAVPATLEEAAAIDGCGTLRTIWSVVIPLVRPGVLTVAILQGMSMWNDLYLALVFLRRPEDATVPLGLLNFFQKFSIDWPQLLAALVITTIPVVIIFLVAQRAFVRGLTAGAVKG